jgi:histone H2A
MLNKQMRSNIGINSEKLDMSSIPKSKTGDKKVDTVVKPNTKRKKSRFFETYISKVLKQLPNNNGITSNSKQQLNSALCVIARTISSTASRLTEIGKKKTMSDKEVCNAVKLIFSDDLAVNTIKHCINSVDKFNSENTKGSSRQGKAGIIFPPSIAEKFLRNFGYSKVMVTSSAPVFLASVLEYITVEILIMASKYSFVNKRVRITIRDLYLSVAQDHELSSLFENMGISFIGGGSIPYIHPCLISKKPRKKKINNLHTSLTEIKKPHRFRQGTVAMREIKKYQKMSNCLIFAKYPFERFVRSIVNKNNYSMKISKDVFIVLQYYIEQYIVDILKQANSAAIHTNRVKLMLVDIEFICNLRGLSTEGFSDEPKKKIDCNKSTDLDVDDNTVNSYHLVTDVANDETDDE